MYLDCCVMNLRIVVLVTRLCHVGYPPVKCCSGRKYRQAANLARFRASEDPSFEAGIPDFMNGILNFSIHFNVVHRKVDWWNPKMKSLNSMPDTASWYH